jgi:hypothetical protein
MMLFVKKILPAFIFCALILIGTHHAHARTGVGVGTGKIQVDTPIMPGTVYELPAITVLNTGDEPGDFEVDVSFRENQPEKRPEREWFSYNPQEFYLDQGETKQVSVTLTLPVKAVPGDYFAFIEARPMKRAGTGITTIGIAAASKLYFSISPANMVLGMYHRVRSFWEVYRPWTTISAGLVIIFISVGFFRSYFKLNVNLARKTPKKLSKESDDA